jgi:hypothetical protein
MAYTGSNRRNIPTADIVISLCILTLFVGSMMTNFNVVDAKNKRTTLKCDGPESCNKTECINGDCEITITNSSDISSSFGTQDTEKISYAHIETLITKLIEDRMSMNGNGRLG